MAYASAMASIKAILVAVTGVINTFDHVPRKETIDELKTSFVDSGIFHTYWIRRVAVDQVEEQTSAQIWRTHRFHILCYHQVDDSAGSEATFQAILDLILDEFDKLGNITFDGTHDQPFGAQLIEFTEVQGGGIPVLCHRATIEILVNEVVNP